MIPFYGFANPQEEDKIVKKKSRNEYTRHVPFGVSHRTRNPQPAKTTHGRPLEEMTCRSARTGQSVDRKPLRHRVLISIRVAESIARRRILGLRATVCPLWDQHAERHCACHHKSPDQCLTMCCRQTIHSVRKPLCQHAVKSKHNLCFCNL